MFLGINTFWALTARVKMSLSRAQNILMPVNINSIVLLNLVSYDHRSYERNLSDCV